MTTGLVIGKFYPPHRGHSFLIATALAEVDQLTVVVCEHPSQSIPGETRAAWLQELHPRANIIVAEDFGDDENSQRWAEYTLTLLGSAPDVVFTSEPYGPRYADLMGSRHVSVDPHRRRVPVSSTAIRADPAGCWEFLESPVRASLAKRIAVVGAESTGTTTLAEALAAEYETECVPEFGRMYSEQKLAEETCSEEQWRSEDFVRIATRQQELEDEAARRGGPVLICDTDVLATSIWHERYMKGPSPEVESLAEPRRPALYLLTSDEGAPFVQDGLRDGEHIRSWMTARFAERLRQTGRPFVSVRGTRTERVKKALEAIDGILVEGWRLADPIG